MSSPDTSKQLFTQSIFIAKNLATKLNSLASTIVVPTQLTEANSIILYCALECKKCNSVQDLTSFQPNVQNPAAGNEFLAVVYNLPVLHNLISLNGENSISEIQRQFYLDHIKLLNVKPLILSEKEKLRKAKVEAAWNFQPNQSVETFLNMEDSQVGKVKLPQKDKRNIMITSALPYVNNVPHLGNIIGCILSADCVARYHRNKNNNCIYICGTDEYGTATEKKAIEEGLTCQAICDKYNAIHQEVYQWFQCEFDYFGRTTTENQTEIAQNIFLELKKNGKLLEQEMDQLYDTKMDMFLADRFVTGTCPLANCGFEDARGDQCDKCGKLLDAVDLINPVSVMSKTTPIVKKSKHLFIKLDEIEPELKDWLQKSLLTDKITSKNTKAIAGQWTKKGLMPRCITRDLKWGTAVPVKGYESKVFYVWFDAPIGYISMTKTYCGQNDDWKQWWMNPENVEYFQYMGKDNVAFHSVVFPSTLIGTGQNWTKVTSLNATEYLNYEGGKFSKSRGTGVFGNHAKETGIPSDYWRFYLLFLRPEEKDTDFNWNDFQLKINSDLLKNYGNFCNRPLNLAKKYWNSKVPVYEFNQKNATDNLHPRDREFIENVNDLYINEFIHYFELSQIRNALRSILAISSLGNSYLQDLQPWKLYKQDEKRAAQIVALAIQLVGLLAILIEPFMPILSKTMMSQLGLDSNQKQLLLPEVFGPMLKSGHTLGEIKPLISQISDDTVRICKEKYQGKQA